MNNTYIQDTTIPIYIFLEYQNTLGHPNLIKFPINPESLEKGRASSSSKTKKEFRKKGDSFYNFFKEGIKGDYLLVEDISGNDIVCKNISITEGSMKDYYKYPSMKKISITKDDIVKGNVKRVYRGYKGHLEGKK